MLWFGKKKIDLLSGNIIQNPETGRFIAFFDEFPDLTAEADNEDDVKERLVRGLIRILHKNKPEAQPLPIENAPVKHFQLSTAL